MAEWLTDNWMIHEPSALPAFTETYEATRSAAIARSNGWWTGWRRPTHQCQPSTVPVPLSSRAAASMTSPRGTSTASAQVRSCMHFFRYCFLFIVNYSKNILWKYIISDLAIYNNGVFKIDNSKPCWLYYDLEYTVWEQQMLLIILYHSIEVFLL